MGEEGQATTIHTTPLLLTAPAQALLPFGWSRFRVDLTALPHFLTLPPPLCPQAPAQVLAPSGWTRFKDDLATVLTAFAALPITVPATGLSAASAVSGRSGVEAMYTDGAGAMDVEMDGAVPTSTASTTSTAAATLSVKYLTSSKLFGLQVLTGFRVQGGVRVRGDSVVAGFRQGGIGYRVREYAGLCLKGGFGRCEGRITISVSNSPGPPRVDTRRHLPSPVPGTGGSIAALLPLPSQHQAAAVTAGGDGGGGRQGGGGGGWCGRRGER